jgi:hypothetical protein
LTRKGIEYVNMVKSSKDYGTTIETFYNTLTKHHNPNTLKKLNEENKYLEQHEYFCPKLVDEEHEKGNVFFKKKQYLEDIIVPEV